MDIGFISDDHKNKYYEYIQQAGVYPQDLERQAFFYIMAGSPDLISKDIKRFYDFTDGRVKLHPDSLEEDEGQFCFCTSSQALCRLALNLYNSGFPSLSVSDTFRDLDGDNKQLAMEAIRLRFNING